MISKIIKAIKNQDDKILKAMMVVFCIDCLVVLPGIAYYLICVIFFGKPVN
jgi:hypothetical protein